ncbi:hypothetical protein RTCCBAU85039_0702 [Rhizobium tibeticum]|uniref:Uncharacterized protein n=1 Tax=Rhizobium tibeticum TaxID=501024 RepID=A0A1K0K3C5_9HYPH|nr:hypothetical protein RTCCBAU85039_0702 [Rhizobium tibeticum]
MSAAGKDGHLQRRRNRRCGTVSDEGSAHDRGGADRRRRRTFGQMATPGKASTAGAVTAAERSRNYATSGANALGNYVESVKIGNLLYLSAMLPVVGHGRKSSVASARAIGEGWTKGGRNCRPERSYGDPGASRIARQSDCGGNAWLYIGTRGDFRDLRPSPRSSGSDMLSGRVVIGLVSIPLGLPVEIKLVVPVARTNAMSFALGMHIFTRGRRMVRLGGLEPPTSGATNLRSNQLSYNRTNRVRRDGGHIRGLAN